MSKSTRATTSRRQAMASGPAHSNTSAAPTSPPQQALSHKRRRSYTDDTGLSVSETQAAARSRRRQPTASSTSAATAIADTEVPASSFIRVDEEAEEEPRATYTTCVVNINGEVYEVSGFAAVAPANSGSPHNLTAGNDVPDDSGLARIRVNLAAWFGCPGFLLRDDATRRVLLPNAFDGTCVIQDGRSYTVVRFVSPGTIVASALSTAEANVALPPPASLQEAAVRSFVAGRYRLSVAERTRLSQQSVGMSPPGSTASSSSVWEAFLRAYHKHIVRREPLDEAIRWLASQQEQQQQQQGDAERSNLPLSSSQPVQTSSSSASLPVRPSYESGFALFMRENRNRLGTTCLERAVAIYESLDADLKAAFEESAAAGRHRAGGGDALLAARGAQSTLAPAEGHEPEIEEEETRYDPNDDDDDDDQDEEPAAVASSSFDELSDEADEFE